MDVQGNVNGIDTAGAGVAMPHIISRAEWGAAPWGSTTAGCGSAPDNARARLAVVHHTDTSNNYTPAQAFGIVKSIQTFEIGSRGFCDLSYNFLVDRYGQIFEGRTNSVYQTPIGGHARGFNTGSIGVALIGQYQTGEPIPAATRSRRAVQRAARSARVEVLVERRRRVVVRLHDESVLVRRRLPQLQVARRDTRRCCRRSSATRT